MQEELVWNSIKQHSDVCLPSIRYLIKQNKGRWRRAYPIAENTESQNALGWKGHLKLIQSNSHAVSGDICN